MATRADIEVNVKGLKKVQELSKQLDKVSGKVNQLNRTSGAKTEKQTASFEEKRAASMVRVRNIGDQIQKAKEAGLKTDKASSSINKAALANDKGKLVLAKAHMKSAMNELEAERATTQEMKSQLRFSKLLKATRSRGGGTARPDKFNDRSNAAATRSGLISGAFPLLFGQGPLGGAAGFAGGFFGTKIGGQMGGFAGGLVATAALQTLTNVKDAINQFGAELNDPSANLDKLILRIKDFDRSIVTSAATLKNAGLDQVAGELASVTLRQRFGAGGTDALKGFNNELSKFAQRSRDLGTQLSILVSGPLTLFFKLLNVGISDVERANKNLTTKAAVEQSQTALTADQVEREELLADFNRIDKRFNEVVNRITELTNKQIAGTITGFEKAELRGLTSGPGSQTDLAIQRGSIERQLAANKASLADNKTLLRIRKLQKQALESGAKVLQEQISLERVKIGITQGNLSEKALAIEQKKLDIAKQNRKITIADANLKALKRNKPDAIAEIEIAETKLANLKTELGLVNLIAEARIRAADPTLSRIDELNRQLLKLNDTQLQTVELSKAIGSSFEESFKGVIKGTITVQQAFARMLNRIADHFLDLAAKLMSNKLQSGILGLISKSVGGGSSNFGKFDLGLDSGPNFMDTPQFLKFADGGRPPVNRPSIVGEKGPELFVPRSSGNIIPNNKLGGGGSTSVVVNVDASGSDVQGDEAEAKELGTLISVAVQGELLKQQRPGGLLSR